MASTGLIKKNCLHLWWISIQNISLIWHANCGLPFLANRPWVCLGQQCTEFHAKCRLSQILYGVTVLGSHIKLTVFSEFWEAISFPDKWKRHNYGCCLPPPPPSSYLPKDMVQQPIWGHGAMAKRNGKRWTCDTRPRFFNLSITHVGGQIIRCCGTLSSSFTVELLAASLALTKEMPVAFSDNEKVMCVPVVTTKIIFRHCQMPRGRQKLFLVENHCIRLRPETCYHWISCSRRKLNPYLFEPLESGVLLLADKSVSHNKCTRLVCVHCLLWPTTTAYWVVLASPRPIQALPLFKGYFQHHSAALSSSLALVCSVLIYVKTQDSDWFSVQLAEGFKAVSG